MLTASRRLDWSMQLRRRDFLLSGLVAGPLAAQSAEDPVFRGGTLTVTAPVTVLDRDERYVNGLEPKDFTLFDNGVPQDIKVEVTYVPISIVLAIQANNVVEHFLPTIKKL